MPWVQCICSGLRAPVLFPLLLLFLPQGLCSQQPSFGSKYGPPIFPTALKIHIFSITLLNCRPEEDMPAGCLYPHRGCEKSLPALLLPKTTRQQGRRGLPSALPGTFPPPATSHAGVAIFRSATPRHKLTMQLPGRSRVRACAYTHRHTRFFRQPPVRHGGDLPFRQCIIQQP